jgi:glutamate dehydrogenase
MVSTLDIVEVGAESGLGVEEVARVHFRIGSVLQLHWLLGHILALSRDDRWQALARAALRDDLYSLHRALTAEVLRSGSGANVEKWVEGNPAAERCLQTLGDIRGGGTFDLTTLPVAVREVRNLLQAPDQGSDPLSRPH